MSTGTGDKAVAEKYLRDFKAALEAKQDKAGCGALLKRYAEARNKERIDYAIVPLTKYFKELPPTMLTEQDFREYTTWRQRANGTARTEIGVLRSACRMAGYRINTWLPPRSTPRNRFLSREEAQAFLAGVQSEHLLLFVLIALATGARKTSILTLSWDRVDLARRLIDFNEPGRALTKKRRAVVPIGKQLAAALRDAKQSALTPYVIEWEGKPVANIKRAFASAAKRSGLPWLTPHHLKHSAISWLAEDGWTVDQIADMTETDPATVRRIYRKFNPDYLRDLANSQEERIMDAIQNRQIGPFKKLRPEG